MKCCPHPFVGGGAFEGVNTTHDIVVAETEVVSDEVSLVSDIRIGQRNLPVTRIRRRQSPFVLYPVDPLGWRYLLERA